MTHPSMIMKLMNLKNEFTKANPKFAAFLNHFYANGLTDGTVIEITLTKPGEEPITTNMKVTQADLDLLQEIKNLSM